MPSVSVPSLTVRSPSFPVSFCLPFALSISSRMPPYLWRVLTNTHLHFPPMEVVSPSHKSHNEVNKVVSEATFRSLCHQLASPPVKEPVKYWWNDQLLVCFLLQYYI